MMDVKLPKGFVVCELPDASGGTRDKDTQRIMDELEQFKAAGIKYMGREYQTDYECKQCTEKYRNVIAVHSRTRWKGAPDDCDRLIWAKVYKRGKWMIVENKEVDE